MHKLSRRPAVAARALEFTILTAARSGETRGMTWGEIDLEERVWTVPGERMKAGAMHQVPLSDVALNLLLFLKPDNVGPEHLVFAAPRGGAFSDMAMSQLLKRMGHGDVTVHGFRSAFRDWAGEVTQFGREEVEMALAHTIESATERAYQAARDQKHSHGVAELQSWFASLRNRRAGLGDGHRRQRPDYQLDRCQAAYCQDGICSPHSLPHAAAHRTSKSSCRVGSANGRASVLFGAWRCLDRQERRELVCRPIFGTRL